MLVKQVPVICVCGFFVVVVVFSLSILANSIVTHTVCIVHFLQLLVYHFQISSKPQTVGADRNTICVSGIWSQTIKQIAPSV